jgi:hypothetical protein
VRGPGALTGLGQRALSGCIKPIDPCSNRRSAARHDGGTNACLRRPTSDVETHPHVQALRDPEPSTLRAAHDLLRRRSADQSLRPSKARSYGPGRHMAIWLPADRP